MVQCKKICMSWTHSPSARCQHPVYPVVRFPSNRYLDSEIVSSFLPSVGCRSRSVAISVIGSFTSTVHRSCRLGGRGITSGSYVSSSLIMCMMSNLNSIGSFYVEVSTLFNSNFCHFRLIPPRPQISGYLSHLWLFMSLMHWIWQFSFYPIFLYKVYP